jgi:hypothetical protein
MEVPLVLLADYANVSQEGKLNVLGIFNVAFVRSLPGGIAVCYLVARFVADTAEKGSTKQVEFKLIDPDGKELISQSMGLEVPRDQQPGPAVMEFLSPINWLRFNRYGTHRICVLVNGETKNSLEVIAVPPPAPPDDSNA